MKGAWVSLLWRAEWVGLIGLDREASARHGALANGSGLRSRRQRRPAAPGLARWQRRHDFGALGFGHLLPKADFQRRPAATLAVLAIKVHAADVDAWVGDGNGWDHDFVRVDVANSGGSFSDWPERFPGLGSNQARGGAEQKPFSGQLQVLGQADLRHRPAALRPARHHARRYENRSPATRQQRSRTPVSRPMPSAARKRRTVRPQ